MGEVGSFAQTIPRCETIINRRPPDRNVDGKMYYSLRECLKNRVTSHERRTPSPVLILRSSVVILLPPVAILPSPVVNFHPPLLATAFTTAKFLT